MDRVYLQESKKRSRFPRTRGDGPYGYLVPRGNIVFPPHARGWTLATEHTSSNRLVSPARAGMDHGRSVDMWSRVSFPRTRGDGPVTKMDQKDFGRLPPHARGWTYARVAVEGSKYASPARAGMDRRET